MKSESPADGAKDGFMFMEYTFFFSINLVSIWKITYFKAFTTTQHYHDHTNARQHILFERPKWH